MSGEPRDLSLTNVFSACQPHNTQLRTVRLPIFLSLASSRSQIQQLLQLSHLQDLSVDLGVYNFEMEVDHALMPACVPLFPNIQTLNLMCCNETDWLQPLVDHMTALTRMHSLNMQFDEVPDRGQVRDLLENISTLSSLRKLRVSVPRLSPRLVLPLSAFTDGLQQLTQLTSLDCSLGERDRVRRYMPGLVSACVPLTRLRELSIGKYHVEGHVDCMRVLPHLPLHMLSVVVHTSAEARLLREVVVQLEHLRELQVWGDMTEEDADGLQSVASALPACYTVRPCCADTGSISSVYSSELP